MANNSVVTQEVLQNTLENYHKNFVYDYLNGATHTGFTPVGTVISYFGETAPEHFLVCDGTEYAKSDYPQLADLLLNLTDPTPFEGSDANHFKVPDLRGEFLRGTGTNGHANQGSGAGVGTHQDGTISMGLSQDANGNLTINRNPSQKSEVGQTNVDTYMTRTHYKTYTTSVGGTDAWSNPMAAVEYTSRPTNTSVTYIIAYKNIYIDLALDSFPLGISNPTDGQLLMYDATAGRWVNGEGGSDFQDYILIKDFSANGQTGSFSASTYKFIYVCAGTSAQGFAPSLTPVAMLKDGVISRLSAAFYTSDTDYNHGGVLAVSMSGNTITLTSQDFFKGSEISGANHVYAYGIK